MNMAIFEKIGNAIASGVSGTASKAKDLGELQKLNSELSSKKKELNALYAQIGKTYVESTDMEKIGELKNKAHALIAEIDAIGDKINDNKGMKKCEHCGEVIDNASVFCARCGGKQTKIVNKCIKCRKVLAENTAFCPDCGTKQNVNIPQQTVAAPAEAVAEEVEAVVEPAETVAEEVEAVAEEVEEACEATVEEVAEEVAETEAEDVSVDDIEIADADEVVPEFVPAEKPEIEEAVVKDTCTACGAEVEEDSAFCMNCGASLNAQKPSAEPACIFCSECGNKEDVGTRFCSECGTKL